jgi:ribosomal protein S18 acetylase RimI-like enzyme
MKHSSPANAQVKVRAGTAADAGRVYSLIRGLAAHEGFLDNFRLTRNKLKRALADKERPIFCLVASCGKRTVGLVLFFYCFASRHGDWFIFVEDLFVTPEYRRRGIGKQLLREVAQRAVSEGCPSMLWVANASNKSAVAFYKSLSAVRNKGAYQFVLRREALERLTKEAA